MAVRVASRVAGVVLALATLGASTALGVSGGGSDTPPDAVAAKVLAAAERQVGDPYVYGATGPDQWDCSGLTSTLWRAFGGAEDIPRRARDQQAWAWPLAAKDARPGDLVFFGDPVSHVAFYLGDGRVLDASASKKQVVTRKIWTSDVVRYGRVPRSGVPHPAVPSAKTKAPAAPAAPAAPVVKPVAKAAPHLNPIPPAGHQPRTATTPEMSKFVWEMRSRIHAKWRDGGIGPEYDAVGLVRRAWRKAGFTSLPVSAPGIERLAHPVALRALAVGDLIFYGSPAVHVAVYVGNGQMIDASKVLRVVSRRRVFASETVRFARLTPVREKH
jgi:cell wall-associated NlpC family hydrolase